MNSQSTQDSVPLPAAHQPLCTDHSLNPGLPASCPSASGLAAAPEKSRATYGVKSHKDPTLRWRDPVIPIALGHPIDDPVMPPLPCVPARDRCTQRLGRCLSSGLLLGNVSPLSGTLLLRVWARLPCSLTSSQLCKDCVPASASMSRRAGSRPSLWVPARHRLRRRAGRDAFPSPIRSLRSSPSSEEGLGWGTAKEGMSEWPRGASNWLRP